MKDMVTSHEGCSLLSGPKPDKLDLAVRLTEFCNRLAPESVAIIVSNPECTRSNDTEFPYRQNSDVLYLNGFPEPESVLIISNVGGKRKFTMLVRPRDRHEEIWHGIRQGVEGAKANYMADEAHLIEDFEDVVERAIAKAERVYYKFGVNEKFDELFKKVWADTQKPLFNPTEILHEMRLFKTEKELVLMRHAAAISAEAHMQAMHLTVPGMPEYQLQAIIEYVFRFHGAMSVAYGSIVAGGNNAIVLHYTENTEAIKDGDLILVDAACEYGGLNGGYASDITRCWPANGAFSPAQAAIYQLVLDAQMAAIAAAKPGVQLVNVHRTAARVMRHGLKKLGILPATSTAASDRKIEKQKEKAKKANKGDKGKATAKPKFPLTVWDFFPHGTSHWMGLDVHDVGSYDEPGKVKSRNKAKKERKLEPGMVFTVEPGLYFDKSDRRVPAQYRGIGVRIEDDIVITETGNEVLTAAVVKTIADIEAVMAGRS